MKQSHLTEYQLAYWVTMATSSSSSSSDEEDGGGEDVPSPDNSLQVECRQLIRDSYDVRGGRRAQQNLSDDDENVDEVDDEEELTDEL